MAAGGHLEGKNRVPRRPDLRHADEWDDSSNKKCWFVQTNELTRPHVFAHFSGRIGAFPQSNIFKRLIISRQSSRTNVAQKRMTAQNFILQPFWATCGLTFCHCGVLPRITVHEFIFLTSETRFSSQFFCRTEHNSNKIVTFVSLRCNNH